MFEFLHWVLESPFRFLGLFFLIVMFGDVVRDWIRAARGK